MGNVNFHWPHEGWDQVFACRYVQSVGKQLRGIAVPEELPPRFKSASLLFHTPWGTNNIYYYFSAPLQCHPGSFLAAQRYLQANGSGEPVSFPFLPFIYFLLHRLSWVTGFSFQSPGQGKGNLKQASLDLTTLLFEATAQVTCSPSCILYHLYLHIILPVNFELTEWTLDQENT